MKEMQYTVVHTKGNHERKVMTFSNKHAAMVYGKQFFDTLMPNNGVVTVEGFVDGDVRRRIFGGWHFHHGDRQISPS